MAPIQACKNLKEKVEYNNLKGIREVQKAKLKLGHLVRTADIKRVFSKGDSTNWSHKLYTITQKRHDTMPSYRIDYLTERYNENLILPTKLSLDENNKNMKELNLIKKNKLIKWNWLKMKWYKKTLNKVSTAHSFFLFPTILNVDLICNN